VDTLEVLIMVMSLVMITVLVKLFLTNVNLVTDFLEIANADAWTLEVGLVPNRFVKV